MPRSKVLNHRENRFHHRAQNGLGKALALRELNAAAKLWQEHVTVGDGFVVDFGAGNGIFWDIVGMPDDLIMIDVSYQLLTANPASSLKITANALEPPLDNGICRGIVALGLIEYIHDLEILFRRWRTLAMDGCVLLVSNSPPIAPNLARQWFGYGAIARKDETVRKAMVSSGWSVILDKPVRVGWQSLFVAK